jgi:di/tricarboxylate transporter
MQSVLMATATSLILTVFGRREKYIVVSIYPLLAAVPLAFVNVAVMSLYLLLPKRKPLLKFFASPQSELIGDICLYLNMILWQTFWGILMGFSYATGSSVWGELGWASLFLLKKDFTILPPDWGGSFFRCLSYTYRRG